MKTFKRIRENPWKKILRSEWKRYKTLFPFHKSKCPKFYWTRSLRGRHHALCNSSGNYIQISERYKSANVSDQNFLNILRHELAHLRTRKHGSDFIRVCEVLGGTRYATYEFKKKKQLCDCSPLVPGIHHETCPLVSQV